MLIPHSLVYFTQEYEFEKFVSKRNAFEETLNNARGNGRDLESAAIIKDVAQWNMELAEYQYMNSHWFLGQYIDDRIESLIPIR